MGGSDGEGTTTSSGNESSGNETGGDNATDDDGENFAFYEEIEAEVGDTPDNLKVLEQRLFQTEQGAGVMGRVKNTGKNPYSYLEAQVTVYDDKDEVLFELVDESEEDDIKTFPPGAVWDFVVDFEEAEPQNVARYTIEFDGDVEQTDEMGTNSSE